MRMCFSGTLAAAAMAAALVFPTVSLGAVKCGDVGVGAVAWNNVKANEFGLANGPYSCVDAAVSSSFRQYYHDRQESHGGQIVVGSTTSDYAVASFVSAGFNRIGLHADVFAQADSEWADYVEIVGPESGNPVPVTFKGHLDGMMTLSAGKDDSRRASVLYWLGVAGASTTFQIDVAGSRKIGDAPKLRTSEAVDESFEMVITLPVNVRFGVVGALSASVGNGGDVSFDNTGALDRIVVPAGYSVEAHGIPLAFDGTGYGFPSPVPEPASVVSMLSGIIVLRILRRGRYPWHVDAPGACHCGEAARIVAAYQGARRRVGPAHLST